MWFNNTELVLDMGYPEWLWVQLASGAIRGTGQIWWGSVPSAYLGDHMLQQISWDDVREVFNNQLFSTTVVEEKSMTLMQEDMTLADYHAQFLAL